MTILITGGTGFIGRHLLELWAFSLHEIIIVARNVDATLFHTGVKMIQADICDAKVICEFIQNVRPHIVIHSAAISRANDCEAQRDECFNVNVKGTKNVINGCKVADAKLIFMSTDFVFGHHGPYKEADAYCPVNYYGESKVMAEKLLLESGIRYAIVRTVMVYGKRLPGQSNTFLHWVKENLELEKEIKVFTDQLRTVTFVNDLCRGLESVISTGFEGIIHLCGQEIFTPYQMAQRVATYFNLNQKLIIPVTKHTFPEIAIRPENATLIIEKAIQELKFKTTPIQVALPLIFSS